MRLNIIKTLALSLMTLAPVANAALPPLDPHRRADYADAVVVGQMLSVSRTEVSGNAGTDWSYTAQFEADRVEKGENLQAGDIIEVHYRKTKTRPRGWCGPQGQNELLKANQDSRLFLRTLEKGYALLEPNGWEQVTLGQ